MITYDKETGWGFTLGTQPFIGYATRDAAAEALYDLERGRVTPSPEQRIIEAVEAATRKAERRADDAEMDVADWIDKRGADYSARLLELLRWIDAHFAQDEPPA